ncbi:hypothetical protein [Leptolyngbya sp. CCY15150]|uniref:hypothetical protein n=1 Tax=Leptolyngbya sp. CCY15150 TaxID=2767772 RepID=UPI0019517C8B|nr:hypothetical protein [Leptolyngbya sp. CCY15150]
MSVYIPYIYRCRSQGRSLPPPKKYGYSLAIHTPLVFPAQSESTQYQQPKQPAIAQISPAMDEICAASRAIAKGS